MIEPLESGKQKSEHDYIEYMPKATRWWDSYLSPRPVAWGLGTLLALGVMFLLAYGYIRLEGRMILLESSLNTLTEQITKIQANMQQLQQVSTDKGEETTDTPAEAPEAENSEMPEQKQEAAALPLTATTPSPVVKAANPLYKAVMVSADIKEAIHQGKPFSREVTEMRGFFPEEKSVGALLDKLMPFVESGVKTPLMLSTSFSALMPELEAVDRKSHAGSWKEGLNHAFSSVVKVHKVGKDAPKSPLEIAAAMENALKEGEIAAALSLHDTLPPAYQEPLKVWQESAKATVEAEKAANALYMAVATHAAQELGK